MDWLGRKIIGAVLGVVVCLAWWSFRGPREDSVEKERGPRYTAFAEKFGRAVQADDLQAAWDLMSSHYQAKTSQPAFADKLRRTRKAFGAGDAVEIDHNTLKADTESGDALDFPRDIPAAQRRARMSILFGKKAPEGIEGLWEVWINIIDEDGEDRIVTLEIPEP